MDSGGFSVGGWSIIYHTVDGRIRFFAWLWQRLRNASNRSERRARFLTNRSGCTSSDSSARSSDTIRRDSPSGSSCDQIGKSILCCKTIVVFCVFWSVLKRSFQTNSVNGYWQWMPATYCFSQNVFETRLNPMKIVKTLSHFVIPISFGLTSPVCFQQWWWTTSHWNVNTDKGYHSSEKSVDNRERSWIILSIVESKISEIKTVGIVFIWLWSLWKVY